MNPFQAAPLLDAGISLGVLYCGPLYGFLALIAIVFLEAKVMRDCFPEVNYRCSVKYSAILNIVSTIAGIPLMMLIQSGSLNGGQMVGFFALAVFAPYYLPGMFRAILIAFVLTIVVELGGLFLLIKPTPYWEEAVRFTFAANVRSYLLLFLAPTVIQFAFGFFLFLIQPGN